MNQFPKAYSGTGEPMWIYTGWTSDNEFYVRYDTKYFWKCMFLKSGIFDKDLSLL